MTTHDTESLAAELTAEEVRLREELRALEDRIHSNLRHDRHTNMERIEAIEKQIRRIVVRLSALEHERIELGVAARL